MQAAPAAAAAALTALSVLLTLDCLSAHRPPNNQIQQQTDETAQKKNQPHIVFILTDDQVCVRVVRVRFLESKCLDGATETRKHTIVFT